METSTLTPEVSEDKRINEEKNIYGTFFLGNSEFSLSVSYIQEVVNPPLEYTKVPLAPDYLIGLLNLRGTIIPIIDLKKILKVNFQTESVIKKIAILEIDGSNIGIMFDSTGEIFREQDDERSEFMDQQNNSVIRGVFKKDNGKRIIQLLDTAALLKLNNIPLENRGVQKISRQARKHHRGLRKQCISFKVGPSNCALSISDIQEIIKTPKIEVTALAVGFCIGAISLRGVIVPVIDFPAMLGYRDADTSEDATAGDRRIIVMRLGEEFFGLLVDSVDNITPYYEDNLLAIPSCSGNRDQMFKGCIASDGQNEILLINIDKIFSDNEIMEITHGHSKLYRANPSGKGNSSKRYTGNRKTYITFTIEGTFSIAIEEVKEIIELPNNLLKPSGMPEYIVGLLNLRGSLATIIDARKMYSRPSIERSKNSRVLIFQQNNLHFGLIVDSVENIVSLTDSNKLKLPEALFNSKNGGPGSDVIEAVQVKGTDGVERNMLIIDSHSIAKRLAKAA